MNGTQRFKCCKHENFVKLIKVLAICRKICYNFVTKVELLYRRLQVNAAGVLAAFFMFHRKSEADLSALLL